MRRAHKLLSLLLVLTLALSISAPVGAAYSDTSGHWAESAIDRWTAYGIVSGDGNGFNPDGNLTRGQMAKVLAETLGLTKQGDNPFADVPAGAWYTPYVLRCYEAGIMMGDGVNANPDATITREEAMVMLCRALGIAPASEGALASFNDGGNVASWAKPYVAAMVSSGIVSGVGNNTLAPTGNISRAALMTILDRSIVQYINEPGSYELTDKTGIVLVAAGDVTLTGSTSADVLVSPAAEGKAVAFDGATVTGSVTVQAEDAKVTSANSTLPSVSFTGEGGGKVEQVTPTEPTKPTTTPTTGGGSSSGGGSSTPSHTHSWGEGAVTTAATCTTAGVKTFTCSCGQTKTDAIPALGHTPAEAYTTDETGHWHACTVCGEPADKTAHTYPEGTNCTEAAACTVCEYAKEANTHIALDAGTVTTAATCTEDGVKTYTCSACDETTTEVIPATGHTEVIDEAVEATCTTAGKTEGKHCSVCEAVITAQTVIDALGHDPAEEYTTDESGHWHVCARCNEAVDKTAHTYEDVTDCDEPVTCTVCSYEKAAGTHVWGEAAETKAATCTEAGEKTYTCTVCSETKTEEIPMLAHTEVVDAAVAATCTEAGKTEGKHCSVCNTVITAQETVAATGHNYGAWTKVDENNHKRVCANDASHVETEAHTWNDGVVSGEVKTFTCTVCGATKTEDTSATNVWFTKESGGLYLNWTPVSLTSDEYYFIMSNGNALSPAYNVAKVGISSIYTSLTENANFSIKINQGTHSNHSQLYTDTVKLSVEISNAAAPAFTVEQQTDGKIKISADSSTSGIIYTVSAPDGTVIRNGYTEDGTLSCAPYEGCTFTVRFADITVSEDGKTATVTMSSVATVNTFTAMSTPAAVTVDSFDDLKSALERGGEVTLGADIKSDSTLNVYTGVKSTLRLNGHVLDISRLNISYGKELTIDGTVDGSAVKYTGGENTINGATGSVLEINGGSYQMIRINNSRSITLNNVTAAANSQTVTITGIQEEIRITGGSFSSTSGDAAFINGCAGLVVDGATFDSQTRTALGTMNCGNIEIKNTTLNAKTTAVSSATGNTSLTFTGVTAKAETLLSHGANQSITITFVSGNYTGDMGAVSDVATIAIQGGTFSFDPSAYLSDTHTATKDEADGTWTVT